MDTYISSKSVTFNDVHEFVKTIYPILYMLATVLVSLIVYCLQKCYRNNGECKVKNDENYQINMTNSHFQIAWFIPKRPSEYQRRREVALRKQTLCKTYFIYLISFQEGRWLSITWCNSLIRQLIRSLNIFIFSNTFFSHVLSLDMLMPLCFVV